MDLGRWDAATLIFEALTLGNPRHAYFHALHGVALQRAGLRDDALEAYARALSINPDEPAALVNRAELLLGLPEPPTEEVIDLLERTVALDPRREGPEARRASALVAAITGKETVDSRQ
jgi:tetratricopeptide (TPR) repeat protein